MPRERPRDGDVVAPVVIAPDEADGIFEEEGDADRRDGEREGPALAHGAEGEAIDAPGDGAGCGQRPEPGPVDAPAEAVVGGEGGEGADREIRADREVGETQELPEDGEGDGGQREDAAGHDAVP